MVRRTILAVALAATLGLMGNAAEAARRAPQPAAETVELFAAMEQGQIEVRFIPKDASAGTVLIRNKQDKPLQIRLPDAFAAIPVLAQAVPGGGVGGAGAGGNTLGYGTSGTGTNNRQQGLGGGFGGMGGMGMMGGGYGGMGMGGMFNVAAEATGKLTVATVCLEHGKRDPRPHSKYELRPIASFTSNQQVIELCRMLGNRELDQVSAQAAAWHLTDGLTWNQLAAKVKARLRTGQVQMYFSPVHLRRAMVAVRAAQLRAEQREGQPTRSPGEKDLVKSRDRVESRP